MQNIIEELNHVYTPAKAIVIHTCKANDSKPYVEAYDFSSAGKPVNAHPLSVQEMRQLAASLSADEKSDEDSFTENAWLPSNLLYRDSNRHGVTIWFTPSKKVNMLFKPALGIASGTAYVPSLIWKADADDVWIYAQAGKARPNEKTKLFEAPFFNIHPDGKVCMGTVEVELKSANTVTAFMKQWEEYFWNSYFSHLLGDRSPVKENIVSLWQRLIETKQKFPIESLQPISKTLNNLLE